MAGLTFAHLNDENRQALARPLSRNRSRAASRRLRRLAVCGMSAVVVILPVGALGSSPARPAASVRPAATSGWTALTLQNGWTGSPFGTSVPAVSAILGIVHFKGAIATTGASPVPFTLPAGFRPASVVNVPVDLCTATNRRLQIEPSGVVSVQAEGGAFSNAACFTSLHGASFAP